MRENLPLLHRVSFWGALQQFYFSCSKAESCARNQTMNTAVQRFPRRVHIATYDYMHVLLCYTYEGRSRSKVS